MTRWLLAFLALALTAVLATAGGSTPAVAASNCQIAKPTPATKRALRAAHLRAGADHSTKGPVGRVHLGRCGSRWYAAAAFSHGELGTTDQPQVFRRLPGGKWRDRGDTGGEVCPPRVPLTLSRLWGLDGLCT